MVTTPTRKSKQKKDKQRQTKDKSTSYKVKRPEIAWEKLPEDFVLPDDPVDNIKQPPLAAALTESLNLAGRISEEAATTTNYGICAKVEGRTVVKAPDWSWIPAISVPKSEIDRSYTPVLEGDIPLIVMEFISETEGTEYSIKGTYPPGKWFYYERVLQVPSYAIFEPKTGRLEVYRLDDRDMYALQPANEDERYWLPEAELFLGVWEGSYQGSAGWWLRWWDAEGELLLWGDEKVAQQQQTIRKAIAKLTSLGLDSKQIAATLDLSLADVQKFLND